MFLSVFFFNDTATTEIYTLSLHDALPISSRSSSPRESPRRSCWSGAVSSRGARRSASTSTCETRSTGVSCASRGASRSEEHTSELQSRQYLVCRLLLEKKNTHKLYPNLC